MINATDHHLIDAQTVQDIAAQIAKHLGNKPCSLSLSGLFEKWLTDYAKPHCKRWREFERSYYLYLVPLADRRLDEIHRSDVVSLQAAIANERTRSAANRALELLRMLYNKAIDWEIYSGPNPAARIRKFRLDSRERFLQPEEVSRFLLALETLQNPRTRDYLLMLLLTGQRRGNVAKMKWEQVDLIRGIWKIPGEQMKNGTAHTVPLVPLAVEILKHRQSQHDEWVFAKQDGSGPLFNVQNAWKLVIARANLPGVRMHDLRRTLASWQAIQGANISVIAATLAHRDLKSTQIYARLNLDPVRDAMAKATDAMLNIETVHVTDTEQQGHDSRGGQLSNSTELVIRGSVLTCLRRGPNTKAAIHRRITRTLDHAVDLVELERVLLHMSTEGLIVRLPEDDRLRRCRYSLAPAEQEQLTSGIHWLDRWHVDKTAERVSWDSEIPELGKRFWARGAQWFVRHTVDGKVVDTRIGVMSRLSVQRARERASAILQKTRGKFHAQ